jgi:hypothetical protein
MIEDFKINPPCLIKNYALKDMGNEGTAPHIVNLGIRRMLLVSSTVAAASLLRKQPQFPQ